MHSLADLAVAFVAVNFATFAAFGWDKAQAERGRWRVREDTLLRLAFLGGTPAAYAARHLFRHKTRKQPFSNRLFAIATCQTAILATSATWIFTGGSPGF